MAETPKAGCSSSVVIPGFVALTCDLEDGHEGAHHDPAVGFWEFIDDPLDLAGLFGSAPPDHPNCKCQLATVDTRTIPPWWIAQRLEEVFGPTPPRIFHPLEL